MSETTANSQEGLAQLIGKIKSHVPYVPEPSSPYYDRDKNEAVYERYISELETGHAKNMIIFQQNQKIAQENRLLWDSVEAMLKGVGVVFTGRLNIHAGTRRKPSYANKEFPWVAELRNQFRLWTAYSESGALCKIHSAKQELEKIRQEARLKKQKIEEEEKRRYTVTTLNGQYKSTDAREILEEILNKCPILNLAHAMHSCRNYFDRVYMVESALRGISNIPNLQDAYEEISSLCENYDGDGRVFRDCNYDYSYVYSLVDKDLLVDYDKIVKIVGFD